jgi:hypothetical protein
MQFKVGERYTAEEIRRHLEVGNAGGIRVSLKNRLVRRVVLLTVVPSAKVQHENPYHDRIEGDVLVYSAGGLQGDQSLGGVNKRLSEQRQTPFPIYGFRLNESRRKAEARRWEFLGLLQFLRAYPDTQIDRDGVLPDYMCRCKQSDGCTRSGDVKSRSCAGALSLSRTVPLSQQASFRERQLPRQTPQGDNPLSLWTDITSLRWQSRMGSYLLNPTPVRAQFRPERLSVSLLAPE